METSQNIQSDSIIFEEDKDIPALLSYGYTLLTAEPMFSFSEDHTYSFNDAFNGAIIVDTDDGEDTIDLSGVSSSITVNLVSGSDSQIAGQILHIQDGTKIENVTASDANDVIYGNELDNWIYAEGGDDTIHISKGKDIIDGGAGFDTVVFDANITDYIVRVVGASSVDFIDAKTSFGRDWTQRVEYFVFNDAAFTLEELRSYSVTNTENIIPITFEIAGSGIENTLTASEIGSNYYYAYDLGLPGTAQILKAERIDQTFSIIENFENSPYTRFTLTQAETVASLRVTGFDTTYIAVEGDTTSSITVQYAQKGSLSLGSASDHIDIYLSGTAESAFQAYANDGNDFIQIYGYDTECRVKAYGGNGNDTFALGYGTNYIYGEDGNDFFDASREAPYLSPMALEGLHRIYGGEGHDTLEGGTTRIVGFGGEGNDNFSGSIQKDYLYGDNGDDYLNGRDGDDILYGGSGNDEMLGGKGIDRIYGGVGNDVISGDWGDDILSGEDGNDIIYGRDGRDKIYGGNGDDELHGDYGVYDPLNTESDTLYGGAGDDHLYGDGGDDFLIGGAGADTFHFDSLSIDRVRDFNLAEGDKIDITDVLLGHPDWGISDINEFVVLNVVDATRANLAVYKGDPSAGPEYVGILYGDLTGQDAASLLASGALIAG
ncbi:MAG: calcium-binding protein [Pseudobdellovibrionaceae bacterium]